MSETGGEAEVRKEERTRVLCREESPMIQQNCEKECHNRLRRSSRGAKGLVYDYNSILSFFRLLQRADAIRLTFV